jgi:tRNA-binding protein
MSTVSYDDFQKIDIRSGRIIRAVEFPAARKPAYRLWIDFGPLGIKQSSAQITQLYNCSELVGRQILAVVNFAPKQIADFISEVLVLGIVHENGNVVLATTERDVPPGLRLL